MAKQIKPKSNAMKLMAADQISELDSIYQDSIDTLEDDWNAAHEAADEDIIFDAIMKHYNDRLCEAFGVDNMDACIGLYAHSPQDWLAEQCHGGVF